MKEQPIIFNAEMVRAILDGRKTMTRRVVKKLPRWCFDMVKARDESNNVKFIAQNKFGSLHASLSVTEWIKCPYGQVGDRLWVRETFLPKMYPPCDSIGGCWYRAAGDKTPYAKPWKPSIFMPRWASRITLGITDIRVERVQEISGMDAVAEGCGKGIAGFELLHYGGYKKARVEFHELWDSINQKRGYGWDENPWVWVIEFKKSEG